MHDLSMETPQTAEGRCSTCCAAGVGTGLPAVPRREAEELRHAPRPWFDPGQPGLQAVSHET